MKYESKINNKGKKKERERQRTENKRKEEVMERNEKLY